MSVRLPVAEIARLRAGGAGISAIAKRFRVSCPTIVSRLRMHRGEPAWGRARKSLPPDAEAFWRERLGQLRFNEPIGAEDAMVLRRIAGWLDR